MLVVVATLCGGAVAHGQDRADTRERRCGALSDTQVLAIGSEGVLCPVAREVAAGHDASRLRRGACRSLERGSSCVVRGFRCVPFEAVRGDTRVVCFHSRRTDRKVWWRVGA